MTNDQEQKKMIPSTWAMNAGAIIGLAMIASEYLSLRLVLGGNAIGSVFGLIAFVVFTGGIYQAQRLYRDRYSPESFRYDQALAIGLRTGIFASILIGFYYFLLRRFDPASIEQMMKTSYSVYEKLGISTEEIQKDQELISPAVMAISSFFSYTLISLIVAIISSLFVKKKGNVDTGTNTIQ